MNTKKMQKKRQNEVLLMIKEYLRFNFNNLYLVLLDLGVFKR